MPIEKPNNGQGYTPRTLQDIFREMPDMEIPAGMATARRARLQTPIQDLSKSICILNRREDYPNSMKILKWHGLRLLTYKEALAILTESEELKEQLKNKWFWIAGKGSDRNGWYHFFGNDLVEGRVDDIERNVHCWKGEHPLSLGVFDYSSSINTSRRFTLSAYDLPNNVATAVVGVPKQAEIT